jgi:hypothetical protein
MSKSISNEEAVLFPDVPHRKMGRAYPPHENPVHAFRAPSCKQLKKSTTMTYTGFHVHFEKIAMQQVRSLSFRHHSSIPDGDYAFMPMYCDDKTCDCRRALIAVLQVSPKYGQRQVATISYGWEKLDFYKKWSHSLPPDMLKMFKGPALDYLNKQSPHAEDLLQAFINTALDNVYIERLKKQYAMFKYKQGMHLLPELLKLAGVNEPCPCGSGKVFNLCCGKRKFSVRFRRRR